MCGRCLATAFLAGTISLIALDTIGCKKSETPAEPGPMTGPVTISGRVINTQNVPSVSFPVSIPAKPTVTTDASGNFSAGFTLTSTVLLLAVDNQLPELPLGTLSATAFSFVTPRIPGAFFMLVVDASGGTLGTLHAFKTGLLSSTANVSIAPPVPSVLSIPLDGATGIDTGTVFAWLAVSRTISLVAIVGPSDTPRYYILTDGTTVTIPDMTRFGLSLPRSSSYTWNVTDFGPLTSVDAATDPASGFIGIAAGVPASDASVEASALRAFTTAP